MITFTFITLFIYWLAVIYIEIFSFIVAVGIILLPIFLIAVIVKLFTKLVKNLYEKIIYPYEKTR